MKETRSICCFVFTSAPVRVLLLRRAASRAAGWQPVTGRVEREDASLEAACVREIREEAGLSEPLELIDLDLETTFVGFDGATYRQRTFAARVAGEAPFVLSPEHEEARWMDADEALRLLTWENDRAALALLLERMR